MGKVTIVDVAKEANVSNSSVSRYLSNPQSINPILAVRIAAAIDKLHFISSKFTTRFYKSNRICSARYYTGIISPSHESIKRDVFSE